MNHTEKIKDFLYSSLKEKELKFLEEYFEKLPHCKTPIEERDILYAKVKLLVMASKKLPSGS